MSNLIKAELTLASDTPYGENDIRTLLTRQLSKGMAKKVKVRVEDKEDGAKIHKANLMIYTPSDLRTTLAMALNPNRPDEITTALMTLMDNLSKL